jgi:hypothetical protein
MLCGENSPLFVPNVVINTSALFPWIDPFFQRSKLLRYPITPPAVQPQVERGQDDQRKRGAFSSLAGLAFYEKTKKRRMTPS